MKKLITMAISAILTFLQPVLAQQISTDVTLNTNGKSMRLKNSAMINAERSFRKMFKNVTAEHWAFKDGGYSVKFQDKQIKYQVNYDKKGRWQSTLLVYDENQMPAQLRRTIKSAYVDFDIVKVVEVSIGNKHTYFVKIQDSSTLKTIQVVNGEIVEVEHYIRS